MPANRAKLGDSVLDPLGISILNITDAEKAAAEQGVRQGVFGAMVERFDGAAGAFAYLLFILLYFPCVATIAAIKREAGRPWAIFVAAWTTTVAYITASSFYQIARWAEHPASSFAWLAGMWIAFALLIVGLRQWGRRSNKSEAALTERVKV